MNLDDLLLKEVADLTDDEKGFLREHKDELEETEKETSHETVALGERHDGRQHRLEIRRAEGNEPKEKHRRPTEDEFQ